MVIARIEQKMVSHERRDLLVLFRAIAFSVQCFGYLTLKRGVALVRVAY